MKKEDIQMPAELMKALTEMKAIADGAKDKKEMKKLLQQYMKDQGFEG